MKLQKNFLRLQNTDNIPVLKNKVDGVDIPPQLKKIWSNNVLRLINSYGYKRLSDEDKAKKNKSVA
jgi:hypothetical protein